MLLIDILEVVSEYTNVIVLNDEGIVLAAYNGKDSIPKKYNYQHVNKIDVDWEKKSLLIAIDA